MDGSEEMLSGTFVGRYTVERELGRGATATVYLARDTQLDRAVAIKVLRPELAASVGADRFLREIAVNESLEHPHIAPVLDSGEHDGLLFFVLPHMEGGSLRHLLRREKQLSVESAITIARNVADALDYAHGKGLIHRDVKPENILFSAGQACLADFGIARAIERTIDESTTSTGLVRGTPAYMSPEQAGGGRDYDGRSDQFSLACVLYEMLAGMPAFMGPTPEAIIAQRFQHAPRKLHVYRASISPGLEGVIERALSLTPADRFATMAAFGDALRDAPRQATVESPTPPRNPWLARRQLTAVAGAVVGVAALAYTGYAFSESLRRGPEPDSTKFVILPVESESQSTASEAYDQLHLALSRWSGIVVTSRFEMNDAIAAERSELTDAVANRVSRQLGAGRYVRVRIAPAGERIAVNATLFETDSAQSLASASARIPVDASSAQAQFDTIATQLLLRGRGTSARSRVLPAVQAYEQAMEARAALDLVAADSLLMAALEADTTFGQAALRLAQIRTWSLKPTASWKTWVDRALRDTGLSQTERAEGRALASLSAGDAPKACGTFLAMAKKSRTDFASWYTAASCFRLDTIVVRDSRTLSGWRFRSSYFQATNAYARSFELAPALHRRFQPGAYRELRSLLFTGRGLLRPGVAASPDTGRFYAYASWAGDSLVFVPFRRDLVTSLRAPVDARARAEAITHQRQLFARISRAWSAALPDNAGTKEALAVSLDMLGDPTAADTMRLARARAESPSQRRRLAAEEMMLRVAAGRDNPAALRMAVALADSILRDAEASGDESLSPVAALRGRCRLAGHLSAAPAVRSSLEAQDIGLPVFAYAAAESLSALASMGCLAVADTIGILQLDKVARQSAPAHGEKALGNLRQALFTRVFRSSDVGPAWLREETAELGDFLLQARQMVAVGKLSDARRLIEARAATRGPTGTAEISPDAVLAETELWLSLGDTSSAIRWLDPMLNRASWLEVLTGNSAAAGALVRASLIRARLAAAGADWAVANKWTSFASTLWLDGDPETRAQAELARGAVRP